MVPKDFLKNKTKKNKKHDKKKEPLLLAVEARSTTETREHWVYFNELFSVLSNRVKWAPVEKT